MKTMGILGGLAPESTVSYYSHIIKTYFERFGDHNYPSIIIYSVNFQKYVDWQNSGHWDAAAEDMALSLNALHKAGAEFGIIATNTMHKMFSEVNEKVSMPLLSIMDATGDAIEDAGFNKVGLIGTVFTMREPFYIDTLAKRGIEVIVPPGNSQDVINRIIYEELTIGNFKKSSRDKFVEIVKGLQDDGAQGVILGCTEIPLLITEEDCSVPLFNTTMLHAEKALEYALEDH